MSVVPESAPTKPSVARFWAFTWFLPAGMHPYIGLEAECATEAIKHEKYGPECLPAQFNWPICPVGTDEQILGLVYQVEVCPEGGRIHVQGYAEFAKPCRFQLAQALLGITGAHCEARKSTREACIRYCTKEETRQPGTFPALLGTCATQPAAAGGEFKSRQGKRTDISAMVDSIKSGKRALECVEQDPDTYVKYSRGFGEVRRLVQQAAATTIRSNLHVSVYWGAPGTGKTRAVYDKHGVENVFTLVADNDAVWFDGYEGQDVLLIDDFKGWIKYSLLLKLLDIYPLRCPVKGSFTYASWTKVYITSNYAPDTWYSDVCVEALLRRVHTTKVFGSVHAAMARGLPRSAAVSTVTGGAGAGGAAFAPGFTPPALTRSRPCSLVDLAGHAYTDNEDDDEDGSHD